MTWAKVQQSFAPTFVAMNNSVLPPFQVINDTDKRGLITVIATFFLVSIWICLFLRIYMRLRVSRSWNWDDYYVAGATILATARSAVVYVEVARGYGLSIHDLAEGSTAFLGKAIFADSIIYIFALVLSKYAVTALCLRLTYIDKHAYIIWATTLLCTVWGFVSLLLVVIDCTPGDIHIDRSKCKDIPQRWIGICTFDVLTEIMLFSIPAYLSLQLHMSPHLKGIVFLAFGVRVPVIGASIAHTYCLVKELTSSDPTLLGAYTACWKQIHIDYSILASTLTCIGAFLSPFTKEVITTTGDASQRTSGYALGMTQFSTKGAQNTSLLASDMAMSPNLRPDAFPQKTVISSRRRSECVSNTSEGSQRGIMLHVEWEVRNNSTGSGDDDLEIKRA